MDVTSAKILVVSEVRFPVSKSGEADLDEGVGVVRVEVLDN